MNAEIKTGIIFGGLIAAASSIFSHNIHRSR